MVIHAGDLFDGVRPTNRALAVALEGFLRLSRAGIPVVVIAGNHEHPKLRETGSPLRLLEHLDGVHAVYKGQAEAIEVAGVRVHAVPQCANNETLRSTIQAIEPSEAPQILVVHGAVYDIPAFRHAEFNELSLEPAWFDERFAYVALGHFHAATEISPRAWYSGAPDRVSIAEAGDTKGFLDVQLGSDGAPVVRFREVPGRVYVDLPRLDAAGLDAASVLDAAQASLARVPEGAVARIRIDGLAVDLRGNLDQAAMRKAAAHAMHLDIRLAWADDVHRVRGDVRLGGVIEEFESFAIHQPIEGLDRGRLTAMAIDLLRPGDKP